MSCSVTPPDSLRKSLKQNLELGWQPASPSDPPVSTPTALGVQHCRKAHLAFYVGVGESNAGPHACAPSAYSLILPSPTPCLLEKRLFFHTGLSPPHCRQGFKPQGPAHLLNRPRLVFSKRCWCVQCLEVCLSGAGMCSGYVSEHGDLAVREVIYD